MIIDTYWIDMLYCASWGIMSLLSPFINARSLFIVVYHPMDVISFASKGELSILANRYSTPAFLIVLH